MIERILGLQIGVVKKIDGDPDKENKITVELPVTGRVIERCRVMAPFDIGPKNDNLNIPSVGSTVLIAPLHDNTNHSAFVVIGGMYNSKLKPSQEVKPENEIQYHKTRGGMEFTNNNKPDEQKVTIKTKKEHIIEIDDKEETVKVSNKDGDTSFSMKLKDGEIEISAKKKITLKTEKVTITIDDKFELKTQGGDITLKGNNVKFEAQANFEAKGNGGAKLESGAALDVKASAKASIDGGGMTEVKGGMVKIN